MKKSSAAALAMVYGLSLSNMYDISSHREFTEEELNQGKTIKKKPINKPIPKGMKEFFYGENKVIVLNKKNADKKAKKQGFFI